MANLIDTSVTSLNLSTVAGGYFTAVRVCGYGSYVYFGGNQFDSRGSILRATLADFSVGTSSLLYGVASISTANIPRLWTGDGTTIYANSGTEIVSVLADGSTGTPTSVNASSGDCITKEIFYDPNSSEWLWVGTGSDAGKAVKSFTLATGSFGSTRHGVFSGFIGAAGVCRYNANAILIGSSNNERGYIWEYDFNNGHLKAIVGSGATAGTPTAQSDPYAVPLSETTSISSDADGRVYWTDSTGKLMSMDTDGSVAVLRSSGAYHMYHDPTTEVIIVGGAGGAETWYKYSS